MKRLTIIALVLVAAFAVSVASNAALNAMTARDTAHDLDVHFLDMMTMHHQHGVEMARMVETKGQLPRLKEFARTVIADQERDITVMREMRERHFAGQPQAESMHMRGRQMTMTEMQRMSEMDMERLRRLEGAEFDREFLNTFIRHHEMAINMSREEVAQGRNEEVKRKARETIAKQTREIREMREMLRQVGGNASVNSNSRT